MPVIVALPFSSSTLRSVFRFSFSLIFSVSPSPRSSRARFEENFLAERSPGTDHGGDPGLERLLVALPTPIEPLLAVDLCSDAGDHERDCDAPGRRREWTRNGHERMRTGRHSASWAHHRNRRNANPAKPDTRRYRASHAQYNWLSNGLTRIPMRFMGLSGHERVTAKSYRALGRPISLEVLIPEIAALHGKCSFDAIAKVSGRPAETSPARPREEPRDPRHALAFVAEQA